LKFRAFFEPVSQYYPPFGWKFNSLVGQITSNGVNKKRAKGATQFSIFTHAAHRRVSIKVYQIFAEM
jgi:hypothetical protein